MTAAFYVAQSVFSDPGALVSRYDDLPPDPARLARIARDLMIHRLEGPIFGYSVPEDRLRDDAEARYMDDVLRIVIDRNPAPLTVRRDPADRFVGVCRDFALLHCSLLRHAGIPARVRSGFADYFGFDGFHGDHMITEYWDGARGWVLADPQLTDPVVCGAFGIAFDPMDVPRDRFVVAGKAWRAIRAGADPGTYGLIPPGGPLTGQRFVAGNVRLDVAALNKVETLLWDLWGIGAAGGEPGEIYDTAALITGDDNVDEDEVRELFRNSGELRTPATVLSDGEYGEPHQVTLRE